MLPYRRAIYVLVIAFVGVLATLPFHAQNASPVAADNSRANARAPITADSQSNNRADRRTLAQVRKAIVADDTLSLYAHNVKIVVIGGKVTLAGPVHSDAERQQVLADAASVVNTTDIVNKLTIH